jgi:hypothetical protein
VTTFKAHIEIEPWRPENHDPEHASHTHCGWGGPQCIDPKWSVSHDGGQDRYGVCHRHLEGYVVWVLDGAA